MKKKKILLALLASVCVAAGASAFAACNNNGDSHDSALYAAYQTYKESTDNPMSYSEWVEDILEKIANGGLPGPKGDQGVTGKGIKNIELLEDEDGKYFFITFTDNTNEKVYLENNEG